MNKSIALLAFALLFSGEARGAYHFDSFRPSSQKNRIIAGAEAIVPKQYGAWMAYDRMLNTWLDFVSSIEINNHPSGEIALGTKIVVGRDLPIQLHISEKVFVRRPQSSTRYLPGLEIAPAIMVHPAKDFSIYAGFSMGVNYLKEKESYVPAGFSMLWEDTVLTYLEVQYGLARYVHRFALGAGFDF